jgi:hypothetical protein
MWKERLHRLLGMLHLDGRDISVFLMSLLLAFSIWLIHNLSLNYSDTMSVPVVAQCNLEGHSNISSNSSMIAARCRTSGFSLLRARHQAKRKAQTISFDIKDLHHKDGELFYITAAELSNYVTEIFGDGVQLESFLSETVQFRFPFENNKRVPVQAVQMLDFKPQYMAMGQIHLQPDSVTVYGEPFHLEHVDRVCTRTIDLHDLKSSAHGMVKLEPISGVRMSETEVNYSLDVTRYVEVSSEVTIGVRNLPAGRKLSVFPSTAVVVFKCAFPLSQDPTGEVQFYVDYSDFINSKGGKCIAHASRIPEGVIECTVTPEVFDCVEEGRQ